MYVVCLKSKYGFCKYGKHCDKIHFTDERETLEKCTEKYCDKRHPQLCYYFEKYNRCKFSIYCSFKHANKLQNTNQASYDDVCEEVKKQKA